MSELNVRGLMKSSVSVSLVIALCFYAQLNILRCEMKCIVKGSVDIFRCTGWPGQSSIYRVPVDSVIRSVSH